MRLDALSLFPTLSLAAGERNRRKPAGPTRPFSYLWPRASLQFVFSSQGFLRMMQGPFRKSVFPVFSFK